MEEIDVRVDPATGRCAIWSKHYDRYNRPSYERVTVSLDRVPDLIARLQALLTST